MTGSGPGGSTIGVTFSVSGSPVEADFTCSPDGSVKVEVGPGFEGIRVVAPIAWGVLPGAVPDDVVYDPADCPARVAVPGEGVFAGFLEGGNDILALAWPGGERSLALVRGPAGRRFASVELETGGGEAWVGVFSAPAIWHRVELTGAFMEKTVELPWRRPFKAAWKTQLVETSVMTSFPFSDHEEEIWRPETGSYTYPAWFRGDRAVFRLGTRIKPVGHALIYAMDGHESTPLEFMKRRSPATAAIVAEWKERREYAPNRRLKTNIGYWHCWGTAMAKLAFYRYGMQAREGEFLDEHIANYLDLEDSNQERHQYCLDFAAAMKARLEGWKREAGTDPGLGEYFDRMGALRDELERKIGEPLDGMTPAELMKEAAGLGARLKAAIREEGTEDYPEYCDIVERLNTTSAAMQEEVGKWFGTCARKWFQEAAYDCAGKPGAVKYAREIRRAIREALKTRNYEVIEAP